MKYKNRLGQEIELSDEEYKNLPFNSRLTLVDEVLVEYVKPKTKKKRTKRRR